MDVVGMLLLLCYCCCHVVRIFFVENTGIVDCIFLLLKS
jgi:hypothetical protein